jgi:hypothetical protein
MAAGEGWWTARALVAEMGGRCREARVGAYAAGPRARNPEFAYLACACQGQRQKSVVALDERRRVWSEIPGPVVCSWGEPAERIASPYLEGVRADPWVVLFHSERGLARSALFFDVKGEGTLKFVVAGLAPGTWEVWWNGYLVHHDTGVEKGEGVLYFEGRPGGYFLRRLN